jgi:hypothetical protein
MVDDFLVASNASTWDGKQREGGIAEESLAPILKSEGYDLKASRIDVLLCWIGGSTKQRQCANLELKAI